QRQEELLSDCIVSPDVFNHMVDRLREFVVPYQHALETEAGQRNVHLYLAAAILGEWLVILMNVSSPIAFRFRRYIGRQQQALSQRFAILRPPLFPRPYLLRAGCG